MLGLLSNVIVALRRPKSEFEGGNSEEELRFLDKLETVRDELNRNIFSEKSVNDLEVYLGLRKNGSD